MSFSLQNKADGTKNTSCTVTLDTLFFNSIAQGCLFFRKTMTRKQKIYSFVRMCLIFNNRFNPSMSIFIKEPFALLLKILWDVTAYWEHDSDLVRNALWLSNDLECNHDAIKVIYSMILYKWYCKNFSRNARTYGQAMEQEDDRTKNLRLLLRIFTHRLEDTSWSKR